MMFKSVLVMLLLVAVEPISAKPRSRASIQSLFFLQSPKNMTVLRGEEVEMLCEAAPREMVSFCQWSKDGQLLDSPRHSMRGCSLVIQPVLPEDRGEYRCTVRGHQGELQSKEATLEVQVEPGVPSILEAREGDWVEVAEGQELLLTCQSQGGRPHPELHWSDSRGDQLVGHSQEHVTRVGDTGAFRTVSTIRFNPLQPMVVTCSAHSEAYPGARSSRGLAVHIHKEVLEEEVHLGLGEGVQLFCGEAGGVYRWLLNDRTVEGETGEKLDIEEFSREYDNSVVKCVQQKVGGQTRLLKLVRLRFTEAGPRKPKELVEVQHEELVEVQHEENVQYDQPARPSSRAETKTKNVFTCVSESLGGGEPEYVWVEGRLEKTVARAQDSHGGKYRCRRVPRGFHKVKQMESRLKVMAKELRRFSKILSHYTSSP